MTVFPFFRSLFSRWPVGLQVATQALQPACGRQACLVLIFAALAEVKRRQAARHCIQS
jgi:hypothetical protein